LAYDIANDHRRQKIARICESSSDRVQNSVFEGYFTSIELEKLLKKVNKIFNKKEDSLRIYLLCSVCREKVTTYGLGKVTKPPGVIIV
jgi:CRISPR-associated protein Cas2